jgi:NAD(P)-dependent dehydrogenase (short-subunit alcohol dehydrogenase family)
MRLKPIAEQVVVAFGASSGIGRETALRFARRGARVLLSGRGQAELDRVVAAIRCEGGEARAIAAEATEFRQVKAVADGAAAAYGRLDTWVHLAGVGLWAPLMETPPEEWQRVLDVNLNGQAYGAMAALPHLRREGRGALIHLSSIEAQLALPLQAAYSASKHGIHALASALRLELKAAGLPISVTEILPSAINTPLFVKARTRIGVKPRAIPPFYQPGLVAEAILYAAEHPVRHLTVGGAGRTAALLHRLSPRLMDAFLGAFGSHLQRTGEAKGPDAPSSLFEHLDGYDRAEGEFGRGARQTSLYTWLQLHPPLKRALAAAALGTAALAGARAGRQTAQKGRSAPSAGEGEGVIRDP